MAPERARQRRPLSGRRPRIPRHTEGRQRDVEPQRTHRSGRQGPPPAARSHAHPSRRTAPRAHRIRAGGSHVQVAAGRHRTASPRSPQGRSALPRTFRRQQPHARLESHGRPLRARQAAPRGGLQHRRSAASPSPGDEGRSDPRPPHGRSAGPRRRGRCLRTPHLQAGVHSRVGRTVDAQPRPLLCQALRQHRRSAPSGHKGARQEARGGRQVS